MKNILVINALNGVFPLVLRKKYPTAKITCAEVFPFYKDHLSKLGFEVVDWGGISDMKFDMVVGNPPYGKNSNLAVKFLNRAGELSDQIYFVLPRTFRKASIINRIDPHLHLVHDKTVPEHMFPGSIITCYQVWQKAENIRAQIETVSQHVDFDFVMPQEANVCVGRVGAGPCGKVFLDGFEERSPNSHYFLKAKNMDVIQKLQKLSNQFRSAGNQTVGVPSLSKNELIKIYDHE